MSAIDPGQIPLRHASDPSAGLRYLIPSGWQHHTDGLISPFTSKISDTGSASVNAGHWDHLLTAPPSKDELIAGAAWLASEYAEFFLRHEGERVDVIMEETAVGGRPAARAGYRLVNPDGEPSYVRVLVIALQPAAVSFLLGVAPDPSAHLIDAVLASAKPL